jgi:hypothetical protein
MEGAMSNEDHIWFDENGEINQGRVHNGNLFATMRDRALCIRAGLNEEQWLKDHPGVWRPLEDVLREAAAWKRHVEGRVKTTASRPSSQTPSDIRKDEKNVDGAASVAIPPGDPSPPHPRPTLAKEGFKTVRTPSESDFDPEIQIGSRRYVSANRYASMQDISRRTLGRRIAAGEVPPSRKVGKMLFFEIPRAGA